MAEAVPAPGPRSVGARLDRPSRFWPRASEGRWRAWLDRRVPPARRLRLHRSNVFIFPSRVGLAFLSLDGLLVLAAINYQNSLVFALAFLLASCFALTIGHTYRNLAGLEVEAGGVRPVFAGEHAEFTITLRRQTGRSYHALWLGWPEEIPQNVDLDAETEQRVSVPALAHERGWCRPGRLRIETCWPLGLLRAWTWLDLAEAVLVYPRPFASDRPRHAAPVTGEGSDEVPAGNEEFVGMRPYRPGDGPKHIAWKSFARGGDLLVKEFGGEADRRLWLDWEGLPGMPVEERLSCLCAWVLGSEQAGDAYGLRLPGVEIAPGRGPEHRGRVLRALALHGRTGPEGL